MNLALHFAAACSKSQTDCEVVCGSAISFTTLFWLELGFRISWLLSHRVSYALPRSFAREFPVAVQAQPIELAQLTSPFRWVLHLLL